MNYNTDIALEWVYSCATCIENLDIKSAQILLSNICEWEPENIALNRFFHTAV